MGKFVVALAAATIGMSAVAQATECLKSAKAVSEISDARPKYSHYMKGHRDEKCWYPAGEHFEHASRDEKRHHKARVEVKAPPRSTARALVPIVPAAEAVAVIENPIVEAHSAFSGPSVQERIVRGEELTFDEWRAAESLITLGMRYWLQHSLDRIADARRNQQQRHTLAALQ